MPWSSFHQAVCAFAKLLKVKTRHTFCGHAQCGRYPRILVSDGTCVGISKRGFNPTDPPLPRRDPSERPQVHAQGRRAVSVCQNTCTHTHMRIPPPATNRAA